MRVGISGQSVRKMAMAGLCRDGVVRRVLRRYFLGQKIVIPSISILDRD